MFLYNKVNNIVR